MKKRNVNTAVPHLELVLYPRLTKAEAFARLRAELLIPPLSRQKQADREFYECVAYAELEFYRTASTFVEQDGPWYFEVKSGGAESMSAMRALWAEISSADRGRQPVFDVGPKFPVDQFVEPLRSGKLREMLAKRLQR